MPPKITGLIVGAAAAVAPTACEGSPRGDIVEMGEAHDVTARPQHAYTRNLFMAAPAPDPGARRVRRRELQALPTSAQQAVA